MSLFPARLVGLISEAFMPIGELNSSIKISHNYSGLPLVLLMPSKHTKS